MCKLRRRKCPNARSSHPEPCQDKRNIWRIGIDDIQAYVDEAYRKTAERIASGEVDYLAPGEDS